MIASVYRQGMLTLALPTLCKSGEQMGRHGNHKGNARHIIQWGKVLALHTSDPGSISGTAEGLPRVPELIPEYRVRSST